jgi:hypothetical protein
MRHYYAVVKYALPVEAVDQLKMLLYLNPNAVRAPVTCRRLSSRTRPAGPVGQARVAQAV